MTVFSHNRRAMVLRLGALGCATVLIGACRDSGLPGKNTPHEQARVSEWRYPAYETMPAAEALYEVDGRRWQVTGGLENVPEDMLQQVGAAGGVELQALRWDRAPFDRLYSARPDGRLAVVLPID